MKTPTVWNLLPLPLTPCPVILGLVACRHIVGDVSQSMLQSPKLKKQDFSVPLRVHVSWLLKDSGVESML
eukprot:4691309-Pleurochrysis_carterae.AAC.1